MGRKLSGLEPTPFVGLRDEKVLERDKKVTFIGTFVGGPRSVKMKKGNLDIYDFRAEGGTAPIQIKENGELREATIDKGGIVSVFAPTVLTRALKQATAGMRLQVTYLGMHEKGYHNFDVEVL